VGPASRGSREKTQANHNPKGYGNGKGGGLKRGEKRRFTGPFFTEKEGMLWDDILPMKKPRSGEKAGGGKKILSSDSDLSPGLRKKGG